MRMEIEMEMEMVLPSSNPLANCYPMAWLLIPDSKYQIPNTRFQIPDPAAQLWHLIN